MTSRLAITVFAVHDPDASAAFYEQVFGWRRTADVPSVWIEFESSATHHFAVYARSGFTAMAGRTPIDVPEPDAVTAGELYVMVDDPDELDRTTDRLRTAGAPCISPRAERPWGDVAEYYRDPDGNVVAVAYALPHE